jgi:hypothetical protein
MAIGMEANFLTGNIGIVHVRPGATTLAKIGGPVLSKAWYGKGYQRGHLDYLRSGI